MEFPDNDTVMAVRLYEAALTLLTLPDIASAEATKAVVVRLRTTSSSDTDVDRKRREVLAALLENIANDWC